MQIKTEHLEQLEKEVQHIFDSGANEVRVYNMIKAFIDGNGNQRTEIQTKWTEKGRLFIHNLIKAQKSA